jgi:hypothetical protein
VVLEDDVAVYLQTEGLGTVGTTIFKTQLPDSPDVALVVTTYGGEAPIRTHARNQIDPPTISYEQPRFQIKSRAMKEDVMTARDRIQLAYIALSKVKNATINGGRYQSIEPQQLPYFLRMDENRRPEYVFNCAVFRSYTSW